MTCNCVSVIAYETHVTAQHTPKQHLRWIKGTIPSNRALWDARESETPSGNLHFYLVRDITVSINSPSLDPPRFRLQLLFSFWGRDAWIRHVSPRWCKLHWEFELAVDAVPTNYFAFEWLVIKGDAIVDKTAENHRNTALALKYRTFVFFEKLTNIFDIFIC